MHNILNSQFQNYIVMNKKNKRRNTKVSWRFFLFLSCSLSLVYFFNLKFFVFAEVDPGAVSDRRAKLESELSALEKQIESYRSVIREKQKEATTFERDIAILDAKIEKARLEIRARNLTIKKLTGAINERSQIINELLSKIETEKESLAELLRMLNELDSASIIEILLAYDNLSDFFVDVDSFYTLQEAIQNSFYQLRESKENTEQERKGLEDRKKEEIELKSLQVLEKRRIEQNEAQKKKLLMLTKGKEKEYQKILQARQKDAAAIRSQLFLLRGSPAIPFEKALNYANVAFQKTGVRPAFLLGVIAEESELGANLGSGNWKDDLYECYKKIGYRKSAEKQKTAFMEITNGLGLDPDIMPVSKAPYYGCGGAMGPAQFMPTTWMLYENLISRHTGHSPPNPWDPFDAFMAAALLLRDNGAAAGGYNAEIRAALRYLAGSNWKKSAYRFYGDDVMALARKYQEQIDILEKS
jgi:peptidoglycan hydrolase CwlO-like protein